MNGGVWVLAAIFLPVLVMWVLVGVMVHEIITDYSKNPIWKIVIWFFPIGIIVGFYYVIKKWIISIRDYYRFRR